jgi:hypothetical protein
MNQKWLHLSGIVFIALVAIAVFGVGGTNTPDTNASAQKVASFYGDHATQQGIASFLLAAAAPFVVFFGVGLVTALGSRAGGGRSAWSYVLLAGTTLVAGSVLLTAFVHFALANGADSDASPTALQALNVLDGNTWMAFNPSFGVMLLGAAGLLLSAGVLRWLGWIALVLGVAAFIPLVDFFALLATFLWIVVAGVALARGDGREAYAAAPGAA